MWCGDRCDYLPWLQEELYPGDWEKQSRVLWLIYSEGLPLMYEPQTDLAVIRTYLAAEALRNANK